MKKILVSFFLFLFCITSVMALPVTYKGDILVDGALSTDVKVEVRTNLETVAWYFDEDYVLNIEGDEGTQADIYVYGTHIGNVTQPAMGSIVVYDVNFSTLANGASCNMNQACSSNYCKSGTCQTKKTGGGGSNGGGSSSSGSNPIPTVEYDKNDYDNVIISSPEPVDKPVEEPTPEPVVDPVKEPDPTPDPVEEPQETEEGITIPGGNMTWIIGALLVILSIGAVWYFFGKKKKPVEDDDVMEDSEEELVEDTEVIQETEAESKPAVEPDDTIRIEIVK